MTNMKYSVQNLSRVLLLASAAVACVAVPALAGAPPARSSSADLVSMLNAQLAPSTRPAYYLDSSSGKRFLFDRTGPHALLQYEGDLEVYALRENNGPRGDKFYRTDTGRVFLRVTELGNVIVFPMGDRHGAPTSLDAASNAIIPPPHPVDFRKALRSVSDELSDVLGEAPTITVDAELEDYADWTMEAVQTVSKGIGRVSRQAQSRVGKIVIRSGGAAGIYLENSVLNITIAPIDGFAGRPSSEAVAKIIKAAG